MNISRFKKLKQSRKENIGNNVADKVVTEWGEKRPTDLKELSRSIDVDNINIDTEEDIFGVKKSLESSYPRPQGGALRPIHGFATAISTLFTNFRIHPRPQDGVFCVILIKQSLPPSSGPYITEIFHEFCEDIITEVVVSV